MCANVIISNTFSVTASDAKYRGFIRKFSIPGVYQKILTYGAFIDQNPPYQGLIGFYLDNEGSKKRKKENSIPRALHS